MLLESTGWATGHNTSFPGRLPCDAEHSSNPIQSAREVHRQSASRVVYFALSWPHNPLITLPLLTHTLTIEGSRPEETLPGALVSAPPPWHGSSLAVIVCGGAQRGISLAAGTFTGESRRKPPAARFWKKRLIIKGLRNHDLGALDSFAESRESSLWKPPRRKPASGSHLLRSH